MRRGDAQLGGVGRRSSDGYEAELFRALALVTRFESDEQGEVRLVTKLPPLPSWLDVRIRRHIGRDRADLDARAVRVDAAIGEALVRIALNHMVRA